MPLYAFRWRLAFVVALCISVIGYILDLQGLLNEREKLVLRERDIRRQQLKKETRQHPSVQDEKRGEDIFRDSVSFRDLLQLIGDSHLEVVSVKKVDVDALDAEEAEYFQVNLTAEYESFIRLLGQLVRQSTQYEINDMAMEVEQHKLIKVAMLLRSLPFSSQSVRLVDKALSAMSPFCEEDDAGFTGMMSANELSKFPLDQMRMLGVVTSSRQLEAIVLLPDGHVVTVASSMLLGREGGKVAVIHDHDMSVLLPDHSRYFIYRARL